MSFSLFGSGFCDDIDDGFGLTELSPLNRDLKFAAKSKRIQGEEKMDKYRKQYSWKA